MQLLFLTPSPSPIETLQALTQEQQELPVWVYSPNDASAPADDVDTCPERGIPHTSYPGYRPARVVISGY